MRRSLYKVNESRLVPQQHNDIWYTFISVTTQTLFHPCRKSVYALAVTNVDTQESCL